MSNDGDLTFNHIDQVEHTCPAGWPFQAMTKTCAKESCDKVKSCSGTNSVPGTFQTFKFMRLQYPYYLVYCTRSFPS